MLDAAIIGFWETVAWPAFGYMLLGIIIGFWVGLLPGIVHHRHHGYHVHRYTCGAVIDQRALIGWHRLDAGRHRRRSSDGIPALHFRISLFVGPFGSRSRGRGNVRDP